jgi:hypothetical protein
MGIEKGEEVEAKGMHNIFTKIITEIFPNLEKPVTTQVQEASRKLNSPDHNKTTHDILSLKQQVQRLEKEY